MAARVALRWAFLNNPQKAPAMKPKTISGAEFKLRFLDPCKNINDDDEVFFGAGDLSLYRLKERGPVSGPRLVQIEFNEIYSVNSEDDAN